MVIFPALQLELSMKLIKILLSYTFPREPFSVRNMSWFRSGAPRPIAICQIPEVVRSPNPLIQTHTCDSYSNTHHSVSARGDITNSVALQLYLHWTDLCFGHWTHIYITFHQLAVYFSLIKCVLNDIRCHWYLGLMLSLSLSTVGVDVSRSIIYAKQTLDA